MGEVTRRNKRPTLLMVDWPEHGGMRVREVGTLEGEELLEAKNEFRRLTVEDMYRRGLLKRQGVRGTVRVKPEA